jgi:flagellar biosynthesis/type III secretory pathway ATPase
MPQVVSPAHLAAAERLRALLAAHERVRDLVALGASRSGGDALADLALARLPAIEAFLRQDMREGAEPEETLRRLEELAA